MTAAGLVVVLAFLIATILCVGAIYGELRLLDWWLERQTRKRRQRVRPSTMLRNDPLSGKTCERCREPILPGDRFVPYDQDGLPAGAADWSKVAHESCDLLANVTPLVRSESAAAALPGHVDAEFRRLRRPTDDAA